MKELAVLLVLIVLLIWMGVNGAEVGEFVGDFFQGLKPDG